MIFLRILLVAFSTLFPLGAFAQQTVINGYLDTTKTPPSSSIVTPLQGLPNVVPETTYQGSLALTANTSTSLITANVTMASSTVLPANFYNLTVTNTGTNPAFACWFGGTASASAGCEYIGANTTMVARTTVNLNGATTAPTFFSTSGTTLTFRN